MTNAIHDFHASVANLHPNTPLAGCKLVVEQGKLRLLGEGVEPLRGVAMSFPEDCTIFDLLEAIELGFLLDLAEVLVVGAIERKESRGGHAREDYQTRDDVNFMRHTMAYRHVGEDGQPTVRLDYKPVAVTRYEPMERKY